VQTDIAQIRRKTEAGPMEIKKFKVDTLLASASAVIGKALWGA
jgi:hypothetical protein